MNYLRICLKCRFLGIFQGFKSQWEPVGSGHLNLKISLWLILLTNVWQCLTVSVGLRLSSSLSTTQVRNAQNRIVIQRVKLKCVWIFGLLNFRLFFFFLFYLCSLAVCLVTLILNQSPKQLKKINKIGEEEEGWGQNDLSVSEGSWGTSDSSCFMGFLDRGCTTTSFSRLLSLCLNAVVSAQLFCCWEIHATMVTPTGPFLTLPSQLFQTVSSLTADTIWKALGMK